MVVLNSPESSINKDKFLYVKWKKNAKHIKVWKFYLFFWPRGVAASIPWFGHRWWRPTFEFSSWFDDGCWRPKIGVVYWWGDQPTKSYLPNTKRYLKIHMKFRYRARKQNTVRREYPFKGEKL